jgi:hypothetical protein
MSEIWSKMYIFPRVLYRLLSRCTIGFPHYLIIGKFYEKMALNLKCVFRFPLELFSQTFFIIVRNKRDIIKNVCPRVIVKLYNRFSVLSHNWQVLRKNGTEYKMCVFLFSTHFFWNIFHYNKKWVRYDQKCISVLVSLSSCTIVFPHYLIIGKFYENMAQNLKCVIWFSLHLSEIFFILGRKE